MGRGEIYAMTSRILYCIFLPLSSSKNNISVSLSRITLIVANRYIGQGKVKEHTILTHALGCSSVKADRDPTWKDCRLGPCSATFVEQLSASRFFSVFNWKPSSCHWESSQGLLCWQLCARAAKVFLHIGFHICGRAVFAMAVSRLLIIIFKLLDFINIMFTLHVK